MKIDENGRITIEASTEAETLFDLCTEIDAGGTFRVASGEVHPTIQRWLTAASAKPDLFLLQVAVVFVMRGFQACAAWWKSRTPVPLARPYDD